MIFVLDYGLNIIGSEWIIIIFVALILLFGTNKLPEAGKKIGKIVGEYNKAKNEMQNQIKEYSNPNSKENNVSINGPVQTERQKLEYMAKSLGINIENKTDLELKQVIETKFGTSQKSAESDLSKNKFKN
jgi:sec-independent protein translocase protein TatA